jgi:O-antigen ligase
LYQFVGINLLGLPDVIPSIIDYRNFKDQGARVTGFSIEPGTYVIMVAWICLYLTFLPKIFSNKRTKILLILNYSVLILTFSTALIAFFLSIIVINLFFMNFFNKIKFIFAGIVVVTIIIFLLNYFGLLEIFQYVLQYKVENFFRLSTHTLDSGAMRSYTSRLGLEVFKDYPLFGVGAGNSYYFMWLHEFDLGITRWGETLSGSLAPQNAHAKILAERGLFGYLFFILFYFLFCICIKYIKLIIYI